LFGRYNILLALKMDDERDERIEKGRKIMEAVWYNTALYMIQLAKEVYQLNDEQVSALKDVYARPNDYYVRFRDEPERF
jgi:predicted methyltransferase